MDSASRLAEALPMTHPPTAPRPRPRQYGVTDWALIAWSLFCTYIALSVGDGVTGFIATMPVWMLLGVPLLIVHLIARAGRRTCFACGSILRTGETECPSCGTNFAEVARVRGRP